jgi:prophage antirepressor-like protein
MEAIILREFKFEGAPLPVYEVDGKPHWIAKQVGAALGYGKDGGNLVTCVTRDWKGELVEGYEILTLKGEKLRDFKRLVRLDEESSLGRTSSIMLLSEKGLYKVLMLTRKPAGDRMRDWLAAEVLPQIARDGHFAPDRQVVDGKLEARSPKTQIQILLESVQQLALLEGRVEAIEENRREGMRYLAAVPEPEVPAGDVSTRAMIGRIVRG